MVSDLYEGERYVPKFDYPLNEYDTEGFTEQNGFIQYPGAVLGVDVSEHQGDIDWQAVRGAGVEFAILRVGYRGMTEGGLNVDATFEQNYQGAVDAGLQVGVYFFSQAVSEEEAREEANFVLQTLNGRELAYPVVFDWETPIPSEELPAEDLRAYDISGEEVTRFALGLLPADGKERLYGLRLHQQDDGLQHLQPGGAEGLRAVVRGVSARPQPVLWLPPVAVLCQRHCSGHLRQRGFEPVLRAILREGPSRPPKWEICKKIFRAAHLCGVAV